MKKLISTVLLLTLLSTLALAPAISLATPTEENETEVAQITETPAVPPEAETPTPPTETETPTPPTETEMPEEIDYEPAIAEYEKWSRAAERAFIDLVPDIASPAVILIEKETGTVIFEKNADEIREPASVTKIMTTLLVIEALEAETISLRDVVTTSEYAASMGGSQIYLRENEQMTVHELLKASVVSSANDAAVALAEHIAGSEEAFAELMNARAAELGMKHTTFTNSSGLLESDTHRTTARDIAIMSRELMEHDMVRKYTSIWMDSLRDGETVLVNTNRMIRFFEGATGLKTGFTQAAGHCLAATAKRDGIEYIAVVLGASSSNDRFKDARNLLSHAFVTYTTVPAGPDEVLLPIKVDLGREQYIQPEVDGPELLLVTRKDAPQLTKTLTVAEKLLAPVSVGDEVGTLTISSGDTVLAEIKVVASQESARLGWGEIYAKFMELLFVTN